MLFIFKDFFCWVNWKDRKIYFVLIWEIENFIGEFYEGIVLYIFGEFDCVGKLMGLVFYGRENVINW